MLSPEDRRTNVSRKEMLLRDFQVIIIGLTAEGRRVIGNLTEEQQIILMVGIEAALEHVQEAQNPLLLPLWETDIPPRARGALENDGMKYVGDVAQRTEWELLNKVWGMGRRGVQAVKEEFERLGVHLGMSIPNWDEMRPKE